MSEPDNTCNNKPGIFVCFLHNGFNFVRFCHAKINPTKTDSMRQQNQSGIHSSNDTAVEELDSLLG